MGHDDTLLPPNGTARMHRSNRIRMLLGLLFLLTLALIWIWQQNFDARLKSWVSWITVTYGCCAGFWVWLHGFRLARLIDDIPTSRIATAAQGYVELSGRATRFEDQQAKSLYHGSVLWFRKEIARRGNLQDARAFPFNLFYVPTEVEESRTPFAIADGTGTACILPHGAEIICERRETRYGENTRAIEEQILPGDTLYVIGDFSTHALQPAFDQAAYELTRQWDGDPAQRRRFDANRDGRLNQKEWLEMHAAARARVIQDSLPAGSTEPKHLVFRPNDGRPFLISSVPPATLAGHYRLYMITGLLLFIVCGVTSFTMFLGKMM